jgi:hypothetical protein
MERLIIDIPDKKSAFVKQLLTELGVTIQPQKEIDLSARKKRLAKISVWSDEDLKIFDESKKGFENWKPEEW